MSGVDPTDAFRYIGQPFLVTALLAGVPMVILGLLCVASPNFIWRLQRIQNEWRGLTSMPDKPKGWDTRWAIYGTVLVLVGIVVIVVGVYFSANILTLMKGWMPTYR